MRSIIKEILGRYLDKIVILEKFLHVILGPIVAAQIASLDGPLWAPSAAAEGRRYSGEN